MNKNNNRVKRESSLAAELVNSTSDASSALSSTLVVDLDGTLTPTDTLIESIVLLIKRNPIDALRLPFWMFKGRAAFKEFVSSRAVIAVEHLPYRTELLDYLRAEREAGRRVVLATAAHKSIANAVAAHLGLFDDIIASDGTRNLKGSRKLDVIQERIDGDFVYVGDSAADLPIWREACAAVLVGTSPRVTADVKSVTSVVKEFSRERTTVGTLLGALRVHQWLKNLLLFVPLLTAFSFLELDKIATTSIAFFAFSLTASATYLANDLWDLESDRAHPRKCQRALASARISIQSGILIATCSLVIAMLLANSVSRSFLMILIFYVVLTSTYSLVLKQHVLMDVIMLSLLYTLRIIAGSIAIEVATSSWLLAFSVFIFLSLALVKRCAELVELDHIGYEATSGRDYLVGDLIVLWPLGVGSALCSVVVFGLFISAPETQAHYVSPQLLWLVAVGLIYWLSRLWIKTARGQMHDDPLIFAVRNRGSRIMITLMIFTMVVAHFVSLGLT
jgi:4-hydroxybenzoate polyprenyltransferase/phosphoserine phosphatase